VFSELRDDLAKVSTKVSTGHSVETPEGKEEHVESHLIRNTLLRMGTAHQEIIDAARQLETDSIVLASNGYTGLAHVLLGSTTERVVRHAPCPVLVVREKERELLRS
jgi:nucleotide-binding universal stress UspA family protein